MDPSEPVGCRGQKSWGQLPVAALGAAFLVASCTPSSGPSAQAEVPQASGPVSTPAPAAAAASPHNVSPQPISHPAPAKPNEEPTASSSARPETPSQAPKGSAEVAAQASTPKLERTSLSANLQRRIDVAVRRARASDGLQGAVVAVVFDGKLAFLRAYGLRQVKPTRSAMKTDTIFDIASLTKPIATATLVMQLVAKKRLSLSDRVAQFFPEFAVRGKKNVTVEQLLRHTSGLPGAIHVKYFKAGMTEALKVISGLKTRYEPGTKVVYSDIGYIVLAALVSKVAGADFKTLVEQNVLAPLGMNETSFLPEASLRGRIAPTERTQEGWLQGVVHDPRARILGGVAGHAGLFATATDVAKYLMMLCNQGRGQKGVVLGPAAIRMLASPGLKKRTLAFQQRNGGLWHTGFTGTALWVDPLRRRGVVILASRFHPDGRAKVGNLRFALRGLVASAKSSSLAPKKAALKERAK